MLLCGAAIPLVPTLWLFADSYYILFVQLVSGLA